MYVYICLYEYIYIYIYIYVYVCMYVHHLHHHVVMRARISLTLPFLYRPSHFAGLVDNIHSLYRSFVDKF